MTTSITRRAQQIKTKLAKDIDNAKQINVELDKKLKNLLARTSKVMEKIPDNGDDENPEDADTFIGKLLEDLDDELNDQILKVATKH